MTPASRIFCALDTADPAEAARLAVRLDGIVGGIKLGLELFAARGPDGVRAVVGAAKLPLFLDLKLHDIPNTVAGAVRAVVPLAPVFVTLHASGGEAMMRVAATAAAETAAKLGVARPRLLGVTVLTSLDTDDLAAVGQGSGQDGDTAAQVERLAALAERAGLDGIVCSPHEVEVQRARRRPGFTLMVPGIRPAWAPTADQKRVMTPGQAVAAGADYLVVGRPVTAAPDPATAARQIVAELEREEA